MGEGASAVAREDVEALAPLIASAMSNPHLEPGLAIHPWGETGRRVAEWLLSSDWLEGVRAAERERQAAGPCSCPYCCSGTPVEQRGDAHRSHGAEPSEVNS